MDAYHTIVPPSHREPRIRPHIRWMIRRDMPEVMDIEQASRLAPMSEETFLALLRKRDIIGMVAEEGERIVGFFIYQLNKHSVEVLDFAVAPDCRQRGVGRSMLAKLDGKLSSCRRTRINLTVRETNLACQKFLRACGFYATAVVRDGFADTGEDAYRFSLDYDGIPAWEAA